MKSAILIPTLWILVTSASVVPLDESSSTVNVKQGGSQFSYHIQESHGIAVHPEILLKSQIPEHPIPNSLHAKSSGDIGEKIQAEPQLKSRTKEDDQEKQLKIASLGYRPLSGQTQGNGEGRQEYLKVALPGYHLLPGNPQGHDEGEGIQRQPLGQSKIALPGYQLLSGTGNSLIKEEGLQQLRISLPDYHLLPGNPQGHDEGEGIQREPFGQSKITLPGYQLLSGAGNSLIKEEGLQQEQLRISLPGYRLLPANANIQYTDLPYYYPYVHGYGLHYPYNLPLVRYI